MVAGGYPGRALFFLSAMSSGAPGVERLIWASLSSWNVGFLAFLAGLIGFTVLACQLPATVGVIAWEVKAARYHGIFADRLNPNLEDYLRE